jgi:SpoVK/Ycf46/Vps4 family AAA+-type ATPase
METGKRLTESKILVFDDDEEDEHATYIVQYHVQVEEMHTHQLTPSSIDDDGIIGSSHKFNRGVVSEHTYLAIVKVDDPMLNLGTTLSRLSMSTQGSSCIKTGSSDFDLPGFGGYAGVVRDALEVVRRGVHTRSLSNAISFDIQGIFKPPRGILIYGPPGTGKSTLMRKIASKVNAAQEEIDHGILLSNLAGEAEQELRQVFMRAAQRAPCLVLIDDVEKVSPQRSGGSDSAVVSDLQRRITSCMLNILDGAHALDGVFVIATSSHPSSIDPAMRRPGRLERELELGVPSTSEREDILRQILISFGIPIINGQNSESGVSSKCLIEASVKTSGMVAADLLLGVKEAFVSAVRRNAPIESIEDLRVTVSTPSSYPASPAAAGAAVLRDEDLLSGLDRVVPSAIREVAVDVPAVRWTDIGGMMQVKENLREVMWCC